jgi:UDP-GlcNAc:undecaprenyl-phosphate GlcNAc-1-phosphate transferase
MINYIIAFFTTFISTCLILHFEDAHTRFTGDRHDSGPQKIHLRIIPRIGGVGIMLGIFASLLTKSGVSEISIYILFCISTFPIFLLGLLEDITKKITVRDRFLITGLCSLLAIALLGIKIDHIEIKLIDQALSLPIVAILFSVFAITGLTNSYNIIDGLNGLSSMVATITFIAISYVSYVNSDPITLCISLTIAISNSGFFLWNFPKGLIFLGDGGAYLLGFAIAVLSIMLVHNNPNVSPWFAVSVNSYPIIETLFSVYRRKFHGRSGPGNPDALHLHSLLYRRIFKPQQRQCNWKDYEGNSVAASNLWGLALVSAIPSAFFYSNSMILIFIFIMILVLYVSLYKRLVAFKTPAWIKRPILYVHHN